jgi:hypothetical protein
MTDSPLFLISKEYQLETGLLPGPPDHKLMNLMLNENLPPADKKRRLIPFGRPVISIVIISDDDV